MLIDLAVGIGLIVGFLFTELTGLAAGGLVVSGYLALYLDQPLRLAATFAVAVAAALCVRLLSAFTIVYGRRRFLLTVMIAFWLGWMVNNFLDFAPVGQELRVIGYIVPGLIANDMGRQGFGRTILSSLFVAAVVRLVLLFLVK